MADFFWFGGWLLAALALFVAGLRLPALCLSPRSRHRRAGAGALALAVVVAVAVLANIALGRHDAHFDLTQERVFTPDRDALAVVERLDRPVRLTYFYRADDPAGKRARHIVELMTRQSNYLQVTTVDPDRHPSLARTAGIKLYNAALLEADGRRTIVHSTDETDIAIGIQRVLRERVVEICFLSGHEQYPSDNYEFHTHLDGLGGGGSGHGHGGATAVVETSAHGVGRFRRSLEALGYEIRDIIPAIDGTIAANCRVVIDAGPRTPYTAIESAALAAYLGSGGAAMLLYDIGFKPAVAHAALLQRLGLVLQDSVVVDPGLHFASDPEMVAVTAYRSHAVTARMSFTFYPGVRALKLLDPAGDVTVSPLFSSSKRSYSQALASPAHRPGADDLQAYPTPSAVRPYLLAAVSSGRFDATGSRSFRVIVVGDSDFVSNSFYPYMSNSRLALAMVRWLSGEAQGASVAARIPVRQTVVLTNHQQHTLSLLLVVTLPLLVACVGASVWWRRR